MDQYKFFLIIPPGLEDLALQELELKCPVACQVTKGGISCEADLAWMERAHTLLKIPTRMLMRLTEFKVRDFPKLFHKMGSFTWNKFLSHPGPQWEITCSKSRLLHTGRIEETLNQALAAYLKRQPLNRDWEKKNYPPQTFYVRIVDDLLTLSLDLSGEPLYKRGLQTIKGEAPLRENFASAFAFEILKDVIEPVTLVDPMCGSGTLLTEALTFHQPLHLRAFAFETAPFYKGKMLRLPAALLSLPISRAIGFDLNADLLRKVSDELANKVEVTFKNQDSLIHKISEPKMVMLCNPPYGERIKIEGKRGSFLKESWKKFLEVDQPWRFGWVLPSDMDDLFARPQGYKLLSKRHLRNGGMAVTFWIWEKN